jgi:hypothetical protein
MAQNLIYISDNIHISDNLLPKEYSFDIDSIFTNVSGTGTTNYSTIRYGGSRSLEIINLDYQNTDYSFWLTNIDIVPLVNGKAVFSLFVNADNTENVDCAIDMYFGGVLAETYNFTINAIEQPYTATNKWKRYAQIFSTFVGQDITFKFIVKHKASSVFTEKTILIDGLKLEQDNKGVGLPTPYIEPILPQNATDLGFTQLTTTEINALTPTDGLVVYNTTLHVLCFYDGSSWKKVTHSNM